jgi:hypothetical protein
VSAAADEHNEAVLASVVERVDEQKIAADVTLPVTIPLAC